MVAPVAAAVNSRSLSSKRALNSVRTAHGTKRLNLRMISHLAEEFAMVEKEPTDGR